MVLLTPYWRYSLPLGPSGRPVSNHHHSINPPPVNPRVRPRAGSLDGAAYPQHQPLSGPGGPPPAKKVRTDAADREPSRRSRNRPRSQSVRGRPLPIHLHLILFRLLPLPALQCSSTISKWSGR